MSKPVGKVDNLRTPSTEEAREMQRKSAQKRSENAKERKLIRDRILERMKEDDWDEMIDRLIERAKESKGDFETLRDTIGEKPLDAVKVDSKIEVVMSADIDGYSV